MAEEYIIGNDAQFNENVDILGKLNLFDDTNLKNIKISGTADLTGQLSASTGIFSGLVTAADINAIGGNFTGIVTANEYYGTFRGSIDPSVADDKISEGNSTAEVVDSGSNGHFKVTTEGTEKLRITSQGRVGINEDEPSATLHVQDEGTTNPVLYLKGGNAQEGDIAFPDGEALQVGHWNGSDTFTERFKIHSSGRVGIGTNPSAGLHVIRHVHIDVTPETDANSAVGQGNWATESALCLKGDYGGGIAFNDHDYQGWILHTLDYGRGFFVLNGTVGGASTERLRINENGLELRHATEQFNSFIRTGSTNSGDYIGNLAYRANDSAGNLTEYVKLLGQIVDNANGSEDSRYNIETMRGGSLTQSARAESGYFLTPNNPGVYLDALDWSNTNKYMHNGFQFWQVGNHWNNSTGTFTCPVAGKYFVAVDAQGHRTSTQTGGDPQYASLQPQVNNGNVGHKSVVTTRDGGGTAGSIAPHQSFGFSIILDVQANDTIRVFSDEGFRTNTQNHLTIYLLG